MLGHFITFKPTTGVFQKAIQPYKKWYDKSDMSPLIEVDGKYYRILRTTGMINKIKLRKIVICSEEGQLIDNEKLTRKGIKIYIYLNHFHFNIRNMKLDSKQDGPKRFGPLIDKFKKIQQGLTMKLNEEEAVAMDFHLHYYEEVSRLSHEMSLEASKCLNYERQLKNIRSGKLSSDYIQELKEVLYSRDRARSKLEAILIEDGIRARSIVIKVLKNPAYKKYIQNEDDSFLIVQEANEADHAAKRLIEDGKKGWKNEQKWVNPDKGSFDLEKYVDDLRNTNTAEIVTQLNVNEMMVEHWVFSPDCIYS